MKGILRSFLATALLLLALPAGANRVAQGTSVAPNVGTALGGSQKPGYRGTPPPSFRRPFKQAQSRLGAGPALTLQVQNGNSGVANVGYLDVNHYQNIRDTALDLLRTYSPNQHYFVAVGRSPVGIATFLRELDDDMAMTFPASDMRKPIDPKWKQAYFAHFKAFIPADVLKGSRTIVLVDRTREGKTLTRLKVFLEEYLHSIGSSTQVVAVGISSEMPGTTEGMAWHDSSRQPYLFKYASGQFDHDEGVAPYAGKHRIGMNTVPQLTENPNYNTFRSAMRERMESDAALDGVLTSEFSQFLPGR